MVILPADHHIKDKDSFQRTIISAVGQSSKGDYIVTIGIPPGGPETGYGYIEAGDLINREKKSFTVKSFHEKPDKKTAVLYVAKKNFFWNSGIFISKASTLLKEIKIHLGYNYRCLMKIAPHLGENSEYEAIKEAYKEMKGISIDYGVIEQSENVLMTEGRFGWDDVGSWPSAAKFWSKDNKGNEFEGELINIDSSRCIVYSPVKPVALLGVEDLVIIEQDDVLLVCRKERAQDIKSLVDLLKSRGRDELL